MLSFSYWSLPETPHDVFPHHRCLYRRRVSQVLGPKWQAARTTPGPAAQPFPLRAPLKAGSFLCDPVSGLDQYSWMQNMLCPKFLFMMEGMTCNNLPVTFNGRSWRALDYWTLEFSLMWGP